MRRDCPVGSWEINNLPGNGWDRDLISRAYDSASSFGCISCVVIHRGKIIAQLGDLSRKVLIRSIRKSFLSALIGIEVGRRRIRLGDTLRDLKIDDVEELSDSEREASVSDLLKARSGVYHPALAETPEMTAAKPPRGSNAPGSHWLYNNWDFNALGSIYEKATGQSVFEGLYSDIALPIGMEDFTSSDGSYLTGEQSWHPAYHMHMTSRDLARFGFLFLNRGRWNDKQIVPEEWVSESVRAHSFDGSNGYGYMWWTTGHDGEAQTGTVSRYRKNMPPFRYFAHGAYGQMIAVMPGRELVIAHLAETKQRSAAENLEIWEFVRLILEAQPRSNSALG
ncbi:serine hydrolase [Rhizobium sp. P38BS-XIX]|uniref:serine hydrolase domain-containing protein n=1 Tax=Rhizobium sp. P38BS-XIX TaxID=2726740 RepID=UPI001456AC71|nr:serine hydrolase [Rhizobium sp. P38BS-XIX]NLR98080.1 serine hydrolase [Rhizobium sp. P38BS-XIX]